MRRLPAIAAILTLGLLTCLEALGAGRRPPQPRPPAPVWRPNPNWIGPNVPRWNGLPRNLPRNYRPPNGMRVVNANIDVTFTFNGDIGKVRTISPPEEFDDKGNIKKHTKEELKALKGDTPEEKKMLGYKTEISEVQVGDVIQVALSIDKANLKKAAKKDKGKNELEDEAKDEKAAKKKWVVAAQVVGTVTKVNSGNTDAGATLTIRVTTQVLQGKGANNNANRNQTIKPEEGQATLVIIAKRKPMAQPGGEAPARKGKKDNN